MAKKPIVKDGRGRVLVDSTPENQFWRVELRRVQTALRRYCQDPGQSRGPFEWAHGPYLYRLMDIDIQNSRFICERIAYANGAEIDWEKNPELSRSFEFRAMLGDRWEKLRSHLGMEPSGLVPSGEAKFEEGRNESR